MSCETIAAHSLVTFVDFEAPRWTLNKTREERGLPALRFGSLLSFLPHAFLFFPLNH